MAFGERQTQDSFAQAGNVNKPVRFLSSPVTWCQLTGPLGACHFYDLTLNHEIVISPLTCERLGRNPLVQVSFQIQIKSFGN